MDLLATFSEACIEIDYKADGIPATDLYSIYSQWASDNNEYLMTSRKFFMEISKKLPDKVRTSKGITYKNIKFTEYAKSKLNSKPKNYSFSDFK